MHEYSIDTNTRKTVVIIIFILSCCTSCLLGELLNFIINYYALQVEESTALTHMRNFLKFIEFPNLIGVGVIYELISFVHDRWAWKLFHMFNGVPNLNGHWTGTLSSSYGPDNIKMEMDTQSL